MKLNTLLFVSHASATALITAVCVTAMQTGAPTHLAAAVAFSLLILALTSWFISKRIQSSLSQLETAVTDPDTTEALQSGLVEFDQAAQKIGKSAQRWESIASHTRQQSRELQAMVSLLDRRGVSGERTSSQLRELLVDLGNTLHSHLANIERSASEIEQYAKSITNDAEVQFHSVVKTTSYIEQLSSTIDAVTTNAESTQTAIERNHELAGAALNLVKGLIDGMKQIRSESQTSEKKLRGLCDPSQQISAIVGTITDIAARTDLLALNASIESIRAGEHGRGFAIVAEEVRKLAAQAADATREISSLVDAMQIVTQESIRGIERECIQVDAEVDRAIAAEKSILRIREMSTHDTDRLKQITAASATQLQLAQDIILATEQMSAMAKANRSGAENVSWTMKSIAKMTPQFSTTIDRLRKCGDGSSMERESSDDSLSHARIVPTSFAMPVSVSQSVSAMASIG